MNNSAPIARWDSLRELLLSSHSLPIFDTIIVSDATFEEARRVALKKQLEWITTSIRIRVSDLLPANLLLLTQGDTLVAVVRNSDPKTPSQKITPLTDDELLQLLLDQEFPEDDDDDDDDGDGGEDEEGGED